MPSATPSTSLAVARLGATDPQPARNIARQIPAFLNKLYTMVNDPATDELIYWSDAGDSFFVPHHERFAKELLPRFFKHNNYSSFVRQLNMYGFSKVPHLQQGVLHTDNPNVHELWEFTNSNFQRDQPDLLCLVHRKKPAGEGGGGEGRGRAGAGAAAAAKEENGEGGSGACAVGAAAGALDMASIMTGISTIKKHQTAISSTLSALQASNQALWQETLAARERHKRHQDTINRILRFLAGVFGAEVAQEAAGSGSESGAQEKGKGRKVAVIPKKRARLLIEDGDGGSGGGKWATDGEDGDSLELPYEDEEEDQLFGSERFTSIPNMASPPSASPKIGPSDSSSTTTSLATSAPTPSAETPNTSHSASAPQQKPFLNGHRNGTVSPPAQPQVDFAQLAGMLTPRTAQRIISSPLGQSLDAQTQSRPGSNAGSGFNVGASNSDYFGGSAFTSVPPSASASAPAPPSTSLPARPTAIPASTAAHLTNSAGSLALLSPSPPGASDAQLLSQKRDAQAIAGEIDALQQSINALVGSMRLSPEIIAQLTQGSSSSSSAADAFGAACGGATSTALAQPYGASASDLSPDFDVDGFLQQWKDGSYPGNMAGGDLSSADDFLDPTGGGGGYLEPHESPLLAPTNASASLGEVPADAAAALPHKRKSDAAGLEQAIAPVPAPPSPAVSTASDGRRRSSRTTAANRKKAAVG